VVKVFRESMKGEILEGLKFAQHALVSHCVQLDLSLDRAMNLKFGREGILLW
jgi:hypothetical protein